MGKIRINELARQLEVPTHTILDMLLELGVTEKKTHSSSVDGPVAELIRQRVQGGQPAQAYAETSSVAVAVEEPEEQEAPYTSLETDQPGRAAKSPAPVASEAPVGSPGENHISPAITEEVSRMRPAPIRPPLAAGGGAPVHPPLRSGPIPARPAPPPPRPGQILSGPRQPLPAAATPGVPPPMPPPAMPMPASPAARVSAPPSMTSPGPAATPGTPLRPQPRPNLAGQPAARPIVPPRPDMVARLQPTRPAPSQAPQAPRPGVPPGTSPRAPGQPIYRGPIRPGQPVMRGPGLGGAAGGAVPGLRRPRTLHPTSPLRAEPATMIPTTEQQRRHQGKPAGRDRHRDQEQEE